MKTRDKIFILIVLSFTLLVPFALSSIPNHLKISRANNFVDFTFASALIFLLFNIILIGIFASFHFIYAKDYSKIKSVWFFAIFGGITGALLGEFGNVMMIIPYTILMLIYAFFYKRFIWWKVALTTYLAGILIENGINRAPIQVTTLIWIAIFIYPYFAAKIWENRKKFSPAKILNDFKYSIIFSLILGIAAFYFTKDNVSPPLIFLGITLPFAISLIHKIIGILNR